MGKTMEQNAEFARAMRAIVHGERDRSLIRYVQKVHRDTCAGLSDACPLTGNVFADLEQAIKSGDLDAVAVIMDHFGTLCVRMGDTRELIKRLMIAVDVAYEIWALSEDE